MKLKGISENEQCRFHWNLSNVVFKLYTQIFLRRIISSFFSVICWLAISAIFFKVIKHYVLMGYADM